MCGPRNSLYLLCWYTQSEKGNYIWSLQSPDQKYTHKLSGNKACDYNGSSLFRLRDRIQSFHCAPIYICQLPWWSILPCYTWGSGQWHTSVVLLFQLYFLALLFPFDTNKNKVQRDMVDSRSFKATQVVKLIIKNELLMSELCLANKTSKLWLLWKQKNQMKILFQNFNFIFCDILNVNFYFLENFSFLSLFYITKTDD